MFTLYSINLFYAIYLIVSIGISDAIELKFNPSVHFYHNCPDIIKTTWANYQYKEAFLSGIICSYPFGIIILIPIQLPMIPILLLGICNILVPIIFYHRKSPFYTVDIFHGHNMLYVINFISFLNIYILSILIV